MDDEITEEDYSGEAADGGSAAGVSAFDENTEGIDSGAAAVVPPRGVPKYLHLANLLREAVLEGKVGGNLKIADNQLMKRFRVSRSTVRQAVDILVREGLVRRVPGKGTFLRDLPENGTGKYIEAVGWSFEAIVENQYVRDIVMGIERVCEEEGVSFRFYPVREDSLVLGPLGNELRDNAKQAGVALLWPYPAEEVSELVRWGIPVVAANMDYMSAGAGSVVTEAEEAQSIRRLLQPLAEMGHRRVGFMVSAELSAEKAHRLATGYRNACFELGLEVREEYFQMISRRLGQKGTLFGLVEESAEGVGGALEVILGLENPPTAVLASNEPVLEYLAAAAEERGLEIPRDLSVGGITSVDYDGFFCSIRLDQRKIGEAAARMLLEMLESGGTGCTETIEVEYHEGESFGPPSGQALEIETGDSEEEKK